jgi:protein-disulfide isomerase
MKDKVYLYIGSTALLLGLFLLGAKFYKDARKQEFSFLAKKDASIFVRDYSPRYGSKEAKVYLTEFLDPECESCRALYPMVKNLLKEFEGKVQLVVRYAPFHGNSKVAISALEAARMQGKYWETLELLFHYQPAWGDHHNPRPELIFELLKKSGLDMDSLLKDIKHPKIAKIIEQDAADLKILNVRMTPTFFVNGKPLEKFGIDHLRSLIHAEVEKTYGPTSK